MGRQTHKTITGLIAALALVLLAVAPYSRAGDSTLCFGHAVPPFEEVFIKLFKIQVGLMSMDQLKTASAELTDKERAARSYFLGEEGHQRVREGLPPEKQNFLDEKYAQHTGITPEYDFQSQFPHILAVGNNNLTIEQMKNAVGQLTGEEIGSQSFYLGEEGRAVLFTEMDPKRVQVILDRTPDWVFLETGKRKYKQIKDYSCILYKQERLGDKLQGVEKILLKYRDKPQSIYAKWLEGPWEGREVLYNEALLGAGKVRVRESGILGIIPVTLPVDHEIARRGSNHMIIEIGLKYLIDPTLFIVRPRAHDFAPLTVIINTTSGKGVKRLELKAFGG